MHYHNERTTYIDKYFARDSFARARRATIRKEEAMIFSTTVRCFVPVALLALALSTLGCDVADEQYQEAIADNGFEMCDGTAEEGCPCQPGQIMVCYPDSPFQDVDTGEEFCLEGKHTCSDDGEWGSCEFAEDSERYALIGDPTLCGGCDPGCFGVHDCPTGRDLTGENAENVRYDLDEQGIVLGGTLVNARFAYVANNPQSTVSKVDLTTGHEVGRYYVGLSYNGSYNNPSRTAIDSRGNAYVANRAFSRDGSVTKIAGDRSFCVDRDMNGRIDTSAGGHDIRPWNQDECVVWSRRVGGYYPLPRALAIDRHDRVWVGLYRYRRFDVLDPNDGHLIRSVGVSLHPYGAAIGRDGVMWFPNGCCGRPTVQSVNTETLRVSSTYTPPGGMCHGSYGIAVDTAGRVLVGGWPHACMSRYTPSTNTWERFNTTSGGVRGVTVDAEGRMWAASHHWDYNPHWMTSWDATGGDRQIFTLRDSSTGAVCSVPIGVGADFEGRMWTPCQYTSRVAIVDPDTARVQVLAAIGPNPYTYSDFTGFLRATVTAPEGSYTRTYDSDMTCDDDTTPHWSQFYWDAETPEGTQITFWARSADRTDRLGRSPTMEVATQPGSTSPVDLEDIFAPHGVSTNYRYLEIRVQLQSLDDDTSPIFRNMDTVYYCRCECNTDHECTDRCDCDPDC